MMHRASLLTAIALGLSGCQATPVAPSRSHAAPPLAVTTTAPPSPPPAEAGVARTKPPEPDAEPTATLEPGPPLTPFTPAVELPDFPISFRFENRSFFVVEGAVAELQGAELIASKVPLRKGLPEWIDLVATGGYFPEEAYFATKLEPIPCAAHEPEALYRWIGNRWSELPRRQPDDYLVDVCVWGDEVLGLFRQSGEPRFENLDGGAAPDLRGIELSQVSLRCSERQRMQRCASLPDGTLVVADVLCDDEFVLMQWPPEQLNPIVRSTTLRTTRTRLDQLSVSSGGLLWALGHAGRGERRPWIVRSDADGPRQVPVPDEVPTSDGIALTGSGELIIHTYANLDQIPPGAPLYIRMVDGRWQAIALPALLQPTGSARPIRKSLLLDAGHRPWAPIYYGGRKARDEVVHLLRFGLGEDPWRMPQKPARSEPVKRDVGACGGR